MDSFLGWAVTFGGGFGWGLWAGGWMAKRAEKGRITVSAPFTEGQAKEIVELLKRLVGIAEGREG